MRRTVPPSVEIEERIGALLAVGVGENPRESARFVRPGEAWRAAYSGDRNVSISTMRRNLSAYFCASVTLS